MIKSCGTEALVLLADQRAHRWIVAGQELLLKDEAEIVILKTCVNKGTYAMLTTDGRVIASSNIDGKLDVTSVLNDCVGCNVDTIRDLHVNDEYVFVTYSKHICVLLLRDNRASIVFTHEFKYDINLTAGCCSALITRTDHDSLWLVGLNEFNMWSTVELGHTATGQLPSFCEYAKGIIETVCNIDCAFLIMDDGTVRVGYTKLRNQGQPLQFGSIVFPLIEFPQQATVTKIIAFGDFAFCITSEGTCWSVKCDDLRKGPCASRGIKPSMQRIPLDFFIEDMFRLPGSAIIKCTDKLYRFGMTSYEMIVTPVPFFDDKDVVDVIQISMRTYFLMDDGLVYYQMIGVKDGPIELVPLFENNRVAVNTGAVSIRSTRSTLNDDDYDA